MGTTVPEGSGPHTATTIAEHVGEVLPSIEVVDHRFFDWSLGALPVAADNAIHGCWVKGEPVTRDWRKLDLADHEVTVTVDGQVATTGKGSAVLGHPLNVVAWLADELPRSAGSCRPATTSPPACAPTSSRPAAGQTVTADFGPLGSVSITWKRVWSASAVVSCWLADVDTTMSAPDRVAVRRVWRPRRGSDGRGRRRCVRRSRR